MAETDKAMKDLDDLLSAARETPLDLPDGLADRIVADAGSVQAGWASAPAAVPSRIGVWSQLRAALGGWPGLGGMAATCALGLWIGVAPPGFIPDPAGVLTPQTDDVDLFDSFDMAAAMGEE